MSLFTHTTSPEGRRWPRRLLFGFVWAAAGAFLAAVVLANPFHVDTLDALRLRLLGAPPAVTATTEGEPKLLWTCGMHPQIIQDHPGTCPICGMNLVPMRGGAPSPEHADHGAATGAASEPGERRVLFYRNPMDPTITSPVPAQDEMGMDYVPVYEDEARGAAAGGRPSRSTPASSRT